MNNSKIFTEIYSHSRWTDDINDKFSSGTGSSLDELVVPYVEAINKFILTLGYKPNIFDLGCGNFNIGSKIRHLANQYYAGDVVEYLIERNKKVFDELNVNFFVLDAETDILPDADIVIVRQVFQHLSNDSIKKILIKLRKYNYIIITEHKPENLTSPNLDKISGPDTRNPNSYVNIEKSPFNHQYKSKTVLSSVPCKGYGGMLETVVYENKLYISKNHENKIFSQNGEDGIIQYIFDNIEVKSKIAVHIGTSATYQSS